MEEDNQPAALRRSENVEFTPLPVRLVMM